MTSPASELRIPVEKRPATLRFDKKPATNYHDEYIVTETRIDLLRLTYNKRAFDIAHIKDPSKRTKHL